MKRNVVWNFPHDLMYKSYTKFLVLVDVSGQRHRKTQLVNLKYGHNFLILAPITIELLIILQLLPFTLLAPPSSFFPSPILLEKAKVFHFYHLRLVRDVCVCIKMWTYKNWKEKYCIIENLKKNVKLGMILSQYYICHIALFTKFEKPQLF